MQVQERRELIHEKLQATLVSDPVKTARLAGLRYVTDEEPGICRQRVGRGFSYFDVQGDRIRDPQMLEQLKALAIPPAWQDVWICPDPEGHLQATGRDEKGRKQYRYHPKWCEWRSQAKFERMLPFGLALPLIREQTDQHLRQRELSRQKVLAVVVQLLEETLIRVGNSEYAQKNRSFGLTTLRDRHVEVSKTKVRFQFRGKSGVEHEIELCDRRLARAVKRCRDIPGYELFQYFDEEGQRQVVNSEDVNNYLHEITGEDFTAKEFRTWAGTVRAAIALTEMGAFSSETEANRNIAQAIKQVAQQLGNKPATCRKYYVHPRILAAYEAGSLIDTMNQFENFQQQHFHPEEQAVLSLIE
jgi:DNA topoisomerase-1